MFYLMNSKYAIFSNIKVTNIECSAFFFLGGGGDTRYILFWVYNWSGKVCHFTRMIKMIMTMLDVHVFGETRKPD